ncbi:MAG: ABC transporter ATP-binding protein [Archangium sp.]|nr:ABC transporter ATP-binding protein [Archangium sp.]
MVLLGTATGAWAFLLGPALKFLLSGGQGGLQRLFDVAPSLQQIDKGTALWIFPVLIVVIGAIKGVGYLGQFYFVGLFGQRVVIDLRRTIFEKVLRLSPLQRGATLSGDLSSRFTADVAAVEQAATYTVASWMRDSLQIVILVIVAVIASWKLALLALLAVPIAIFPASRLTAALLRRTREGQAALGTIAGQVQEGLGALRTLQAFNAEEAEARRFERKTSSVATALSRAAWARAGTPGLMEILASCAIAGTLAWALKTGAVESDALLSFLGALVLMYQPAKDLGRVSQFALTAAAALERIEAVLKLPELDAGKGAIELARLNKEITLNDVAFSWGPRPALDGINVTFKVGEITALVGESGSGKSTLAALLLRFEVPSRGAISFDGTDVRSATLSSVRAQASLVTQDALLFAGSVRENLKLARANATEEELERALRTAAAWDFVNALPNKLDTAIGERGVTLSGGQKQRLCLARAVLADAPVLILDEATSNLDPQSEREVQDALERVLQNRTAIVIAHRLDSIKAAQKIVVLKSGRVIEQGRHDELLARGTAYAQLWSAQH